MGTYHAIKLIVYTGNKQELQAFLEELETFFDAIPQAYGMSIRALVFKTCFLMYLSYERTGFGKEVKDQAIEDYKQMIQTQILSKYPSFFVEFYMHHWHLRDYKKESHHMGTCFVPNDSLFSVCGDVKNYADISAYFYSLNNHESLLLKDTDWKPGVPFSKYISLYGKSENNPLYSTNWASCQIEDD